MSKKVFIFGDYSQAEARVVAWKGPVPKLKHWFQTGQDVHLNVARDIGKVVHERNIRLPDGLFLRKRPDDYTEDDEERDQSKRTVHGNNYGQGVEKYALVIGMPEMYARLLQTLYHNLFPEIRSNYQRKIQDLINKERKLTTPFGGRIIFYDVVNDDLYREGYAWYPQNIVGAMETKWFNSLAECFKPYKEIKLFTPSNIRSAGLDTRIQAHDALGIVVPDDKETISYAVKIMRKAGEIPVLIDGELLNIPVDFKVGPNWGELKKWKED